MSFPTVSQYWIITVKDGVFTVLTRCAFCRKLASHMTQRNFLCLPWPLPTFCGDGGESSESRSGFESPATAEAAARRCSPPPAETTKVAVWRQLYEIGLPGKLILRKRKGLQEVPEGCSIKSVFI